MGYPEAFEGFMVTDKKNLSDFKKQEVSNWCHDLPMPMLITCLYPVQTEAI